MKVVTAKTAGFCFGVSRAMNIVEDLLKEGKKVCTLGPIIHNPQAVKNLLSRGVKTVNTVSECPDDYVLIIRSHGVPESVYHEIESRKLKFVDATCPFVEKIHRIVKKASDDGDIILIAGDSRHPEVIGIKGFSSGTTYTFKDSDELEKIIKNIENIQNVTITVVSQTTFDAKLWGKCEKIIKKVCTNAKIFDTICNATSKRQEEAERLSEISDLMIVIGGRESSNTAKLKNICEKNCTTVLVETADELPLDINRFQRIGITAGASTPAVIINDVLKRISKIIDTVDNKEELL